VIVLQGPTLAKYDKDLNFIKEVDLKSGPASMDKKTDMAEINKPWMPSQKEQIPLPPSEPAPAVPPSGNIAPAAMEAAPAPAVPSNNIAPAATDTAPTVAPTPAEPAVAAPTEGDTQAKQ